jgi:hypothetical protein
MHRRVLLIVAGATVAAMVVATAVIAVVSRERPQVSNVVTVSANAPYPDVPPPSTTATTGPVTRAREPQRPLHHLEGAHNGLEHFALFTGRCSFLDHHLESTFSFVGPTTWKFHADYCGVIHGDLWTGVGTFTLTAPDGAALTGKFTDSARLPSTGVPYELDITGGTERLAGASGSCVLENHLRMVQFGVQQQFGSVVCDFSG